MKRNSQYQPGFSAYRNVLVALARTAQGDETRWELLRRPFHSLFGHYRKYYPDEFLLRVGLNYCEATKDSELARTLVLRSVNRHAPRNRTRPVGSEEFSDFTIESSRYFNVTSWNTTQTNEDEQYDSGLGGSKTIATSPSDFEASVVSGTYSPEPLDSSDCLDDAESQREQLEYSALDSPGVLEVPDDDPSDLSSVEPSGMRKSGFSVTPVADENNNQQTTFSTEGTPNGETALLQSSPPFSFKVFQKALKVCLAADDLQRSRDILDSYSRMRDVYPKGIESDIWSFVVRGFAALGHNPQAIKGLFDNMKRKELSISEETYGAVIHSLATGKRNDEASALFDELKTASRESGISPGVSCYNSMILSQINSKDWSQVLSTYDEMKAEGLRPNSATTQGLLIASYRVGGVDRARSTMEETLATEVLVSRENCRLALKLLMPDILEGNKSASVTVIQGYLRSIGDSNEPLRSSCLNLLRSIRQADIEQNRLPTRNAPEEVLSRRREEAWKAALRDILDLDQTRRNQTTTKEELNSCI